MSLLKGCVFWLALAQAVRACPVCNTDTGIQVREQIFSASFLNNAALTLAPIAVLATLTILLYNGTIDPFKERK